MLDGGQDLRILGEFRRIVRLEAFKSREIHAVRGLAARRDNQAREQTPVFQTRSVGGDQSFRNSLGLDANRGVERTGIFRKFRGKLAEPRDPLSLVELQLGWGRKEYLWLL